ncbi:hypothetical protein [Oceanibaculum indicum]|uniref:Uncharacterized protein n=1 Tax=Oceanibaculum indicum P24 TaxID=1207063 RepID=K2JJK4_9PROT|nr:hypothetical protein [Oceanibaculum indicum]EKE75518.1 hypothetical protein P24_09866 [Oceanibaculum indicum P24]
MRDSAQNLKPVLVLAPAANADIGTTPLVGTVIDRQGFDSLTYIITTGALTDANASYAVLLEESDVSNDGFTAVADTDLIGTEAAAGFDFEDDGAVRKLGYIGNKRYTRLTITPTGADSGNSPISAVAILGHPLAAPVG